MGSRGKEQARDSGRVSGMGAGGVDRVELGERRTKRPQKMSRSFSSYLNFLGLLADSDFGRLKGGRRGSSKAKEFLS